MSVPGQFSPQVPHPLSVKLQEPYEYRNLGQEGRHIRLLTLLPSIDPEADIECTLALAAVDRLPNYDALSYCWGAKGDNCSNQIYMEGHAVTISTNLEAALRVLRLPSKSRTLWIDALCINQSDMAERAIQVTIMRTIYSKARSVVVWLGKESEDSALAMTSIATLKSTNALHQLSSASQKAVENLISRPYSWFSRVWVVQEFSLGHKIIFICGPDSFEWAGTEKFLGSLLRANGTLNSFERESKKGSSEKIDLLPRSDVWTRLLMERRGMLVSGYGNYKADKSMHTLLESHIRLDVTDEHDRIYGFLGIAESNGFTFSGTVKSMSKKIGLSSPLTPPRIDYTRSTLEVFTDWAKWIIESEKSLGVLSTCQMTTVEENLPSWAPSWRARLDEELVPKLSEAMLIFHASTRILIVQNNNKQVTWSSPKFSFSADNRLLSVTGILLATLSELHAFKEVEPEYEQRMYTFMPAGYLSGVPQSLWGHWKNYDAHTQAIKFPLATAWQLPMDYAATRKKTPARIERLRRVICKNRKQFQSPNGNSGLVPKQTQVGDVIILIVGVETPFVLRPDNGQYRLIGEAFIEGCMKGEKAGGETRTYTIK